MIAACWSPSIPTTTIWRGALYAEAAKAVKYGGAAEEEALKFVTLNPAKQLRVDNRVGSLEPGKDADFAIWSNRRWIPPPSAWKRGSKAKNTSTARSRPRATRPSRRNAKPCWPKPRGTSATAGPSGGDAAAQQQFFETALEQQSQSDDENAEAAIQ